MNLRAFPSWIGVPLGLISTIGLCALGTPHSAALAAAGAVIAVLGVLTIGRPVIRLGYRKWREDSQIIGGGHYCEPPEYKAEMQEQDHDAHAVQIFGPILVTVGTLLNGFSGFVP